MKKYKELNPPVSIIAFNEQNAQSICVRIENWD